MLSDKKTTKLAFTEPLDSNDLLFMTSGQNYAGHKWLGTGEEIGNLKVDRDLLQRTRGILSKTGNLLGSINWKYAFTLLFVFFTHQPE